MYQRVNFLYLAASLVSNVENDAVKALSHFYSNTMVLVKQKAQVKLHPEMKRTFCKKCHALLLPHLKNANIKICKMGRANLKIHCKVCGTYKRYPINKNYCLAIEKQEQEASFCTLYSSLIRRQAMSNSNNFAKKNLLGSVNSLYSNSYGRAYSAISSKETNSGVFETMDEKNEENSSVNSCWTSSLKSLSVGADAETEANKVDDEAAGKMAQQRTSRLPPLKRNILEQTCVHFFKELDCIIHLIEDHRHIVLENQFPAEDELLKLQTEVRPALELLDEKVVYVDEFVQTQFGQCRVNDPKTRWLLQFHRILVKFRQIERSIATFVVDELERIVSLRCRGCDEVVIKASMNDQFVRSIKELDQLDAQLQLELFSWLPIEGF
ncbi:Ribonuclease P protein subunit rpr2 [Trichinella murrelli]|uniref:Ribonuclease P protein subunit rpr2 n=1 Tax=Trichinella murrelli TaxID=144512 RepID=A0A0V0UG75_9BILA|nr:Ribonuclease P protein subunit rpr2 [Trichinella murrelli]